MKNTRSSVKRWMCVTLVAILLVCSSAVASAKEEETNSITEYPVEGGYVLVDGSTIVGVKGAPKSITISTDMCYGGAAVADGALDGIPSLEEVRITQSTNIEGSFLCANENLKRVIFESDHLVTRHSKKDSRFLDDCPKLVSAGTLDSGCNIEIGYWGYGYGVRESHCLAVSPYNCNSFRYFVFTPTCGSVHNEAISYDTRIDLDLQSLFKNCERLDALYVGNHIGNIDPVIVEAWGSYTYPEIFFEGSESEWNERLLSIYGSISLDDPPQSMENMHFEVTLEDFLEEMRGRGYSANDQSNANGEDVLIDPVDPPSSDLDDTPAGVEGDGYFEFGAVGNQNCITVGDTTHVYIRYMQDGVLDSTAHEYIATVSDGSVLQADPWMWDDEYGQIFTLKGISQGSSTLSITNPVNGDSDFMEFRVVNNTAGFTFNGVPTDGSYESDKLTNFYNYSGLTVDSFQYEEKEKVYRVTMDVYNRLDHGGAVIAYNKDGNITGFALIDRHEALPGSFKDSVKNLFAETGDLYHVIKNPSFYSGSTIATRTPIDINVNKGGHLVVTNNGRNPVVFMSNFVGLVVDGINLAGDVTGNEGDTFADASNQQHNMNSIVANILVDMMIEQSPSLNPDFEKSFAKEIEKALASEFTQAHWNYDDFVDALSAFDKRLQDAGLNVLDAIRKKYCSVMGVASVAESAVTRLIPTGKLINWLYSFNDGLEEALRWFTLCVSAGYSDGIYLYPPTDGQNYESNGISVAPSDGTEKDILVHAYEVTDADDLIDIDQSLPTGAVRCALYNITMYKNGDVTRPSAVCEVKIPIPAEFDPTNLKVFRRENDGSVTDMKARVDNGYLVFSTDHFSYYIVASVQNEADPDDTVNPPASSDPVSAAELTVLSGGIKITGSGSERILLCAPLSAGDEVQSVKSFLQNLQTPEGMTLRVVDTQGKEKSQDDIIGTGLAVELLDSNGKVVDRASIVIPGDVLGTGRMSLTQVVRMARAYTGKETLAGAFLKAAAFGEGENVTLTNVVREAQLYRDSLNSGADEQTKVKELG